MDSLLGLEFRKIMQAQCGLVLSATLVWNYPTARAIVMHIAQRLEGGTVAAAPAEPSPQSARTDSTVLDMEDLSDEEALRQLTGRG